MESICRAQLAIAECIFTSTKILDVSKSIKWLINELKRNFPIRLFPPCLDCCFLRVGCSLQSSHWEELYCWGENSPPYWIYTRGIGGLHFGFVPMWRKFSLNIRLLVWICSHGGGGNSAAILSLSRWGKTKFVSWFEFVQIGSEIMLQNWRELIHVGKKFCPHIIFI